MLRMFLGIIVFAVFTSGAVLAQEWTRMLDDPSVNFYDVQNEFNEYWEGKTPGKGQGYKQFRRWENFMEPRVYPSGERYRPDRAARAFTKYQETHAPIEQVGEEYVWTPMGPFSWTTSSYNPGIGRINWTLVDPFDPDKLYICAPAGGLWISGDAGSSWFNHTDNLPALGVTGVAVDYTNPDIIYLGTGDGDAADTYSIGVLKSSDGGETWETTGLDWEIYDARRISKLTMHPTDPQTLWAATDIGVFKTVDGGDSWSQNSFASVKDLEVRPDDPSIVYASGTSFYKSTDGGDSFTLVSSGLPGSGVSRYAMAVTPADPNYVYLLAGRSSDQGFLGLYKSTDSGTTFSEQSDSPNILTYAEDGSGSGGQAWYDLALAASPTDAETIFTGGINVWMSSNGGVDWEIKSHWFYYTANIPYVHADIHSLEFYGDKLYAGCDGGIWVTEDLGESWTDLSEGLQIMQFYRMGGYPADENVVYAGAQDNGCNRYDGEGNWTHVFGADGMECAVDHSNPDISYTSYQFGGIQKSTDGGENYTLISGGIGGSPAWVTPYLIDPIDPDILYVGYSNVWKSTTGGGNWTQLSNLGSSSLRSMAIHQSNTDYIYAASYTSIDRTTDGGDTWEDITSGLPTGSASITYVAVSQDNPDHIWVTMSGWSAGNKVFHSMDGGQNWENISGSLPNLPANCIARAEGFYNELYVGMDVGVYYTNDLLEDWILYSDELPNVIVNEIEIHELSGKLRAATYGRGMWEAPLLPAAAEVEHEPLTDTEEAGPYLVEATIIPGSSELVEEQLLIFYSTDLSFDQNAPLVVVADDHYEGEIPGQGSDGDINYYLSIVDESGIQITDPADAPEVYHSFYAGADLIAPVLEHAPIEIGNLAELPIAIEAVASDNIEMGSVWVEYSINGAQQPAFNLEAAGDSYSGEFPFTDEDVSLLDVVSYQVYAEDASAAGNQTFTDPIEFEMLFVLNQNLIVNEGIPNEDATGVSSVITIDGDPTLSVSDLKVSFKATHLNTGDLIVTLTAPGGHTITLMDRPRYPELTYGSKAEDPDVIFDDEAETSIEEIPFDDGEQVLGTFRPDPGVLAEFGGAGFVGDWTLNVSDHFVAWVGSLDEWGLEIHAADLTPIHEPAETGALPNGHALRPNFPNPFNPSTTIKFDVAGAADVSLGIYNLLGQSVRTLIDDPSSAGYYSVEWNGLDDAGQQVASGIYLYRLTIRENSGGIFTQTRKMLLLK